MERALLAKVSAFRKQGEGDLYVHDVHETLEVVDMTDSVIEIACNVHSDRIYIKFDLAEMVRQVMRTEKEG